jgi:hypothetical protein
VVGSIRLLHVSAPLPFFSGGPPEYGTLVPKHVFDTFHELYFVICALLYFIECDNFYAVTINFTQFVHH